MLDSWSLNLKDHLIQSCFTGEPKSEEIKGIIEGHGANQSQQRTGQQRTGGQGNKGTNSHWSQAMLCA